MTSRSLPRRTIQAGARTTTALRTFMRVSVLLVVAIFAFASVPSRSVAQTTAPVSTAQSAPAAPQGGITDRAAELGRKILALEERNTISPWEQTKTAFISTTGVFAITLIIGFVTLILAEGPLLAVARSAARDISRSFWVGVLWQFLGIALCVALTAILAVTLIGAVAIPFVVLGWALIYLGALTLGLLAIAYVTGRGLGGRKSNATSTRAIELRSLTMGLLLLAMVWFIAAALVSIPFVGVLARIIALAFTWSAATVGFGAVVRSRGGKKVDRDTTTESAVPLWQTPTPVGGVVAARRPAVVTPAAGEESL